MLTVTDEYTRQSLAVKVEFSLKSKDVADALSPLIAERGAPKFLRSDNGSEFVALTLRGFPAQCFALTAVCIEAECQRLTSTRGHRGKTDLRRVFIAVFGMSS